MTLVYRICDLASVELHEQERVSEAGTSQVAACSRFKSRRNFVKACSKFRQSKDAAQHAHAAEFCKVLASAV